MVLFGKLLAMGMDMFFEWTTSVTILFQPWVTTDKTWYPYFLSCLAVAGMAVILEGLRYLFHSIHSRVPRQRGCSSKVILKAKAAEVVVFAIYMSVSYMVMLVAMTYNVGLFVSTIFGHCAGLIIFPRGGSKSHDTSTQLMDDSINGCH